MTAVTCAAAGAGTGATTGSWDWAETELRDGGTVKQHLWGVTVCRICFALLRLSVAISKLAISTLSCCLHCNLLAFHSTAASPYPLSLPHSDISYVCSSSLHSNRTNFDCTSHTITLLQSKQLIFHLNRSALRAFIRLPLTPSLSLSLSSAPPTQSVNCALEISISEFNAHKTHDVYRCPQCTMGARSAVGKYNRMRNTAISLVFPELKRKTLQECSAIKCSI